MTESTLYQVALHFGLKDAEHIESFSDGLIHLTYKIQSSNGQAIIVQAINTNVFQQPEVIISNYRLLFQHLQKEHFTIPAPIVGHDGTWLWQDESEKKWRAQEFISKSYTEKTVTAEKASLAAKNFGALVKVLNGLNSNLIQETIPRFHDLEFRYEQLQHAMINSSIERLSHAANLINQIKYHESLLRFYNSIQDDSQFKKRIMHHDCKLSNILFHQNTHETICPVDLDTTMPGYFFSDVGDMIRSMVPTADENSLNWSELGVRKEIYKSILEGYKSGIGDTFTSKENQCLHISGMLMLYMQAIRFLTDYLSNDQYYQISYADQNLNRAKNQLLILESLRSITNAIKS